VGVKDRMNHEYFLIGYRTTIGKQGFKFIDKVIAVSIKQAQEEFEIRNNFKKLLEKHKLIISKSERWFD